MTKLLELKNIYAGYDNINILEDINLNIYENDFIGIIGPNGGGKTTLIKVILGLLKTYKGNIIKNKDTSFGYLPQYNNIDTRFPITTEEVVLSGLMSRKGFSSRYNKKDKILAKEIIEKTGLLKHIHSNIGEISGGQRQRALLCRAIISSPDILVLDEPVTYVDNNFENELYKILDELNKKMAIIMVSHDLGMISSHVKTIACINKTIHYHKSNIISQEQLNQYDCPIDLITHGNLPHRVLKNHKI